MSRLQLREVQSQHLNGLSHEFGAAIHGVLCNDSAAANHLIELCTGIARPKRGQLLLDDVAVSPRRHSEVGALPVAVAFPHLPVARLMNLALQQKGAPQTAQQLLSDWDLGSLAQQVAGTLDALSARRIALLLALATPKPKLLALHEVFNLGLSRERLQARLTTASKQGAVVLLTAERRELDGGDFNTSAFADASVLLLQPGRLVAPEQLPKTQHERTTPTLFVVCSDARALTEQLSRDPRINSLRLDERSNPHRVEMTGSATNELAAAVADAALQRNIDIRHISPHFPTLGAPAAQPQPMPASSAQNGGSSS
jgi:ABC-type taurine transport system ATPase subunit